MFPASTACRTLALVALLTVGALAQENEPQDDSQVAETRGTIEEVVVVGQRQRPAPLRVQFWDWATEPDTLAIAVTLNFTFTFTLTLSVALVFCCRKRRRDSRDQTS